MNFDINVFPKLKGKYFYKALRFFVLYLALPTLVLVFIAMIFFNDKLTAIIKAF